MNNDNTFEKKLNEAEGQSLAGQSPVQPQTESGQQPISQSPASQTPVGQSPEWQLVEEQPFAQQPQVGQPTQQPIPQGTIPQQQVPQWQNTTPQQPVPPTLYDYAKDTHLDAGNPIFTPDAQASDGNNSYNPYTSAPKKKRKTPIIIVIVMLLICGGIYVGYSTFNFALNGGTTTDSGTGNTTLSLKDKPKLDPAPSVDGTLTVPEIAKKVRPSVVGIISYSPSTSLETLGQPSGEGSGVVMTEDGYIITNAHVVAGAERVVVVTDNEKEINAIIVGSDTKTDIAVLKIDSKKEKLTPAEFGTSSKMVAGETVVAIGNPSGLVLAGSITQGIISAVDRKISGSEASYTMRCIQTDAAINPGNSGGALVNLFGQVVGINSSKIAGNGYEGIGFAIPSDEVKPIVDGIIKHGYIKGRVRLGIQFRTVDSGVAQMNNIPMGIYIEMIDKSLDIYKKGVRTGDIITEIDGKKLSDDNVNIADILKDKKPGETIKLKVYRTSVLGKGSYFNATVTLAEDNGAAQQPVEEIDPFEDENPFDRD